MSEVFDSEDPHLPNLPSADQLPWSDYDFSDEDDDSKRKNDGGIEEDQDQDKDNRSLKIKKLKSAVSSSKMSRKGSIFNSLFAFGSRKGSLDNNSANDLERQSYKVYDRPPSDEDDDGDEYAVQFDSEDHVEDASVIDIPEFQPHKPTTSILNDPEALANNTGTQDSVAENTSKRRKRRRHRKGNSRKYDGSKSKKERVGWEPGVNIETTNVVLKTPGSRITITDYSEVRYRVTRYNLHSEMNPKFNKYTSGMDNQSGIIPHGLFGDDDDYDMESIKTQMPHDVEFDEFLQYMDKVYKSKEEVESAIQSRPKWSKVRWINVVGISWEAIRLLAKQYDLHPLAIEDMIDIPQRTKVDVYKSHLFVIVPLIKLIKTKMKAPAESIYKIARRKLNLDDDLWLTNDGEINDNSTFDVLRSKTIATRTALANELEKKPARGSDSVKLPPNSKYNNLQDDFINSIESATSFRSLTDQPYFHSLNGRSRRKLNRVQSHRPLTSKSLMVGIEQLSMYLTKDNTILTFFEHYTPEVENAILSRLSTDYTILRESCDPSILFHSVLDATSDLLYPVLEAYQRVINEKELEILTSYVPDVKHTQGLHLMLNELAYLKSMILPISSLVSQLQGLSDDINFSFLNENSKLYLNDISDHLLSFIDEITGMSSTIGNLINLVFNTISVSTNNSMQQLSIVTVLFLPLTFWAGFFGMNFEIFGELKFNVSYYWKLAVPFTAGLMLIVMYRTVWRFTVWCSKWFSKAGKEINMVISMRKQSRLKKTIESEAKHERTNWKKFSKLRKRED